jgi:protein-L-isoaspartate(D-aspartate) O-methyltransferase
MATKLSDMSTADMRATMIDTQLRTSDVTDPAVVGAMGAIPREQFVPGALASVAYTDRPVTLGHGRALNAPLVTGRLLVAAAIRPGQRVLLIGGATGYCAALLAAMGAEVHAVEEQAELLATARILTAQKAVQWTEGPLNAGAPDQAPFDCILIDGAIEALPDALVAQLCEGGRLVAAQREGAVTRLVQGVKAGGLLALRPFADMDAVALPGFERVTGFQF